MTSVRQPLALGSSAGTCAAGRRRTAPTRRRRCRRGSRGRRCARRRGRVGSSAVCSSRLQALDSRPAAAAISSRAISRHLGVVQHLARLRQVALALLVARGSSSTTAPTSACSRAERAVALHVAGDRRVGQHGVELAAGAARGARVVGAGRVSSKGSVRAARRRRAAMAAGAPAASLAPASRRRGRAGCLRRNRRETVCASCSRCVAVGGVQLGQRAVQHLLRQAARQRFEHRVDVLALGQQLARARDLGGAPVVGLRVAAPGSAARCRAGRASARSSARRRR